MQTPTEVLNIGIDVAKDEIVVACALGSFPVRKLTNQRAAVLAFLKGLPAGSRIGMESTGVYHELLAEAAHKLGFVVFVLNPKDARHYAKAVGLRGKTDRVDAELIARMIAHEHTKLHRWIPPCMNDYKAFGLMESESWSDSSRALRYVELFASAPEKAIQPLLDAVEARQGQRALDLCCGQGSVSKALNGRGCDIWGVDFSPAMLEIARKGVPGAVFVEGDAQELPFPNKDFDIVVSNFGICHVPDQPRALAEAHRVLRTGGRFAMTVWCGPDASPCFEVLYGAVKTHGSAEVTVPTGPDFHQFAKSQVARDLLPRAGFSDVRLDVADCFFDLDKPERLCEIFENATVRAANLLAAQPPERLSEIRCAVAAMVRNRFSDGGRWHVPMPAMLVSARK